MHTATTVSVHNTLLFFIVCFYCLCSVDILVWGAQAGSQTPKRHLFEDIHRAITLATDSHESSQKRFLLTYSFFFCSVFVSICMFRLQTLSIKLQLQSFNCDFFLSFSAFQQLMIHYLLMNGQTANYLAEHAAPPEMHKPLLKLYRSLKKEKDFC